MNITEKEKTTLETLGFSEAKDKKGLYWKTLPDGDTAYWDFQTLKKGRYYISLKNGGGFKKDTEAKQTNEYQTIRNIQTDTQPTKPKKQEQQITLERKDEAYTLMNIKDDTQVLQEITGAFLDEFVYSFPTKEGKVTGLSWAGVKEVARRMGNISIEDINITETPDTYRVLAKAKAIDKNVMMYGVAEQQKKMQMRTGEQIEDIHALSKCVSRAQRNAIRTLIPEVFIKQMLEQYIH